jgi:hypothetical protein
LSYVKYIRLGQRDSQAFIHQIPPACSQPLLAFLYSRMAGLVQALQYFLRPMDARIGITAVQRPTMRFVGTNTAGQLDLRALHRVRARPVSERTATTVNKIRAFLLDRGTAVAQGIQRLRKALPDVLAKYTCLLSPRMIRIIDITCTLSRRG